MVPVPATAPDDGGGAGDGKDKGFQPGNEEDVVIEQQPDLERDTPDLDEPKDDSTTPEVKKGHPSATMNLSKTKDDE